MEEKLKQVFEFKNSDLCTSQQNLLLFKKS